MILVDVWDLLIKWTRNRLLVQRVTSWTRFIRWHWTKKCFLLRGHFVLVEQQVEVWAVDSFSFYIFIRPPTPRAPPGLTLLARCTVAPLLPPADDLKVPPYLRLNRIPLFGHHNRRTVWWWLCSGSGIPPLMRNLSFTDPPHLPPGLLLPTTPNRNDPTSLSTYLLKCDTMGRCAVWWILSWKINTEAYWSNSLTHLRCFFNEESFNTTKTNLKWIWSTCYQYYEYIRNNNYFATKNVEFDC